MIIVVDIGGTGIKSAVMSRGKIEEIRETETEANKGRSAVIRNIFKAIDYHKNPRVKKICISMPGPFKDLKNGIIGSKMENIPIENLRIKEILRRRYKIPIIIENDGNCFAIGQYYFGKAKGIKNFQALTLGTGLGHGIIINGRIYHGRANAGEISHTYINYKTKDDQYTGRLDDFCTKTGIHSLCRKHGLKIRSVKEISSTEIKKMTAQKQRKALKVWNLFGKRLAYVIILLTNIFDPEAVVLGGKISASNKLFSAAMESDLKKMWLNRPKIIYDSDQTIALLGSSKA